MSLSGFTLLGLSSGLKLLGSAEKYSDTKKTADQIIKQGNDQAESRFQEGRTLQAKQVTGYLSSGIALDTNDTADAVIKDSWQTMQKDVKDIKTSAKNNAANAVSSARANLLGDVASTIGTFSQFNYSGLFSDNNT